MNGGSGLVRDHCVMVISPHRDSPPMYVIIAFARRCAIRFVTD